MEGPWAFCSLWWTLGCVRPNRWTDGPLASLDLRMEMGCEPVCEHLGVHECVSM